MGPVCIILDVKAMYIYDAIFKSFDSKLHALINGIKRLNDVISVLLLYLRHLFYHLVISRDHRHTSYKTELNHF